MTEAILVVVVGDNGGGGGDDDDRFVVVVHVCMLWHSKEPTHKIACPFRNAKSIPARLQDGMTDGCASCLQDCHAPPQTFHQKKIPFLVEWAIAEHDSTGGLLVTVLF